MFSKIIALLVTTLFVASAHSIHKKSLQNFAEGEVVFLGASITEYWMSEGRSVWDEYYAPLGAVNRGKSGDDTAHMIQRIEQEGLLDNLNSRVAILDIGSNDLGGGHQEDYVVDNIGKIIKMLQERIPGIKIIFSQLMPRADQGPEVDQRCRNVNAKTMKYASEEDGKILRIVNLDRQLATGIGQLVWDLYWDDKLHINNKGYRVWAETLAPTFDQTFHE